MIAPPERCPEVTSDQLTSAAEEAVGWFVRNQDADGRWLYQYDAPTASVIADYNVIRHGGVMMSLYQAAGHGIPGALESADRGLAWVNERLVERDDWTAVRSAGVLPVGAASLVTAGLVERRLLTGDDQHDDLMRRLGRFLVAQTEPTGAVLASYDVPTEQAEPGVYSRYYTGEAYWALSRLHLAFPDEEWGEAADRVGGYVAGERDRAEGYWPPLADHWAAYGQSETVNFPERSGTALTDVEAEFALRQAGLFGSQVRWISQRAGSWGRVVRGPFVPRGGGYGVIGEALTGLWLVAGAEPDLAGARPQIAERATCIAGLAVAAQQDEEEASGFDEPDRVRGAWLKDGETRMDDQQHALSALLRTIPIVEAAQDQEPPAGESSSGASPWLWALALVAALNPLRAVFGVPTEDRSSRAAATVAGLAASSRRSGSCSSPSSVIRWPISSTSASRRCASAPGRWPPSQGAADLLRPPPRPDPALPGWRAALVPVAVPVVARPALLILALAAGAADEVPLTAIVMVLAVVVLVAAVAVVPGDGPGRRALRWGSRVTAAVLVAAGVALVVGGVLAV